MRRLTAARAAGRLGDEADEVIDRVSHELDIARSSTQSLRGEPRRALMARLEALDVELLQVARTRLDAATEQLSNELLACAPRAVGLAKRVMDSAAKPALAATLEQEVSAQEQLAATDDFAEHA